MKQIRRWQRILILALLSISVFAPLIFVSNRLKSITPVGRREFIEELSKIRFTTNDLRLSAIEHVSWKLQVPLGHLLKTF
jgi:alpha-1,4-galacturonosyltransferase